VNERSESDGAVPEVDFEEAAADVPAGDEPAGEAAGSDSTSEVDASEPLTDSLTTDVDLPTALSQRDEYLALARRVQADFENFRKRTIKQQSDQASAATARLVESLLPVLDGCDSAVIHGVEGVAPIHKALLDALTKAGLEVVATEGVPFDPTIHEAVLHEPRGPEDEPGEPEITEVLRTGYLWNGRTLRAAMVKVKD
jgi:molecular chaperone GrpE